MTKRMTKMEAMTKECLYPECTGAPIVKVEDGKWICVDHLSERMHSPANMALSEAHTELDEFLAAGGKLS